MLVFIFLQGTVVLNSLVPVNITGNCGMLSLTWTKQRPFYTLSIEFAGNDSSSTWRLSSVSFLANLENNPKFRNATGCNIDFDDMIGEMIMVVIRMMIIIMKI